MTHSCVPLLGFEQGQPTGRPNASLAFTRRLHRYDHVRLADRLKQFERSPHPWGQVLPFAASGHRVSEEKCGRSPAAQSPAFFLRADTPLGSKEQDLTPVTVKPDPGYVTPATHVPIYERHWHSNLPGVV